MGELVRVSEVDDGVVTVVLDRPRKKNALSIALRDELSDELDRLALNGRRSGSWSSPPSR